MTALPIAIAGSSLAVTVPARSIPGTSGEIRATLPPAIVARPSL
jgi:hypothetical protein